MKQLGRLLLSLFDGGVVETEGGYIFKHHEGNPDAPKSPIHFNLRTPWHPEKPGKLSPLQMEWLAEEMYLFIVANHLVFDHIAGLPFAGEAMAEAVVLVAGTKYGVELSLLCLGKVTEGERRRITGIKPGYHFEPGDVVLFIDDVITHGFSKIEAVRAVREQGLDVQDLIVFLDRQEGGVKTMVEVGVMTRGVCTLSDAMDMFLAGGRVTTTFRDLVNIYLEQSNAL